ncbi:tRNA (adenosine(37)-N6)-threonylcarbamoyltransferase complex ATPase subunit type 1 TsaE [Microbacterium sp. SA39]|uniref:tRNA (adenosine(37)-N6)-threonylcarbamoyltransferase complex ATPase subunit type 1 TsaE n=1 Tax=Microbacterium sp. SA39 TaxID=1263625 RepID=UPI00061FBE80|nr:tRNA (adenosine(37)-N6)-threonylcarbamoyltransferase complex ATPase subunit type 1 TsaE [Microbacterium sp. SA39]KJQ55059.1 tRNA threonylcarbamoyladenosine biosynthesis protein TsaE [Microbacterium sp. SA39]
MSVDAAFLGRHEIATSVEMESLGRRIGEQLEAGDVLILTGPLGAGKTTFTRGLADGLGVRGPVQSPTFVIARTHPSLVGRPPLVHVDAYRLGSAEELDDLDLDLDRSVVVIEWGRSMAEELVDSWWDIELERPVGAGGDDDLDPSELDADAPRIVTIVKESAR